VGFIRDLFDDETKERLLAIGRDLIVALAVLSCVTAFFLFLRVMRFVGVPEDTVKPFENADVYVGLCTIYGSGFLLVGKILFLKTPKRQERPKRKK
jgi:hypothetical protein